MTYREEQDEPLARAETSKKSGIPPLLVFRSETEGDQQPQTLLLCPPPQAKTSKKSGIQTKQRMTAVSLSR